MSDWNNPFQLNLLNRQAQNFAATTDIPGELPVKIDLRKDKTKERDPRSLCGSKHAVWIGIQPPPTGGPNKIVPFENSIVVAFWANDTSGGGVLDPGAVIGGIWTGITDPEKYGSTVDTGQQIVVQNLADCMDEEGTVWRCKGEWAEATVFTGMNAVFGTVGKGLGVFTNPKKYGGYAKTIWNKSKISPKNWFAETNESFATDFLGLDYHNVGAAAHKVSIEITCRQNGVTRVVHDTELAGTSDVYFGNRPSPALAYFVIDSPGDWKVRVKSMASGSCADPRLDVVETFTVAAPPADESAAESHSALGDRKITVPLVGLAATLLAYGLYTLSGSDTKKTWKELAK